MITEFKGHEPELGHEVFVAANATVIGRVTIGDQASIWYGNLLRGDVGEIFVGPRTNVQDLTVVHMTSETAPVARIGADVTVGHRSIIHGCTIADHVLIGMGAIILDNAEVGAWSIIGAGSLVTPGKKIPEGSLAIGSPARVVRTVTDEERQQIVRSAANYVELAKLHQ